VTWQFLEITLCDHISHYGKHLISIQHQLVIVNVDATPELIDADRYQITHFLDHFNFFVRVFEISDRQQFINNFQIRLDRESMFNIGCCSLIGSSKILKLSYFLHQILLDEVRI